MNQIRRDNLEANSLPLMTTIGLRALPFDSPRRGINAFSLDHRPVKRWCRPQSIITLLFMI